MKADQLWKCPSCGDANRAEDLRCTCGYEISLTNSGEEDVNYFKYSPTLADDSSAFDYKSGKEVKDIFVITVFIFLAIFAAVGLFNMLFGYINTEAGLALQTLIFYGGVRLLYLAIMKATPYRLRPAGQPRVMLPVC